MSRVIVRSPFATSPGGYWGDADLPDNDPDEAPPCDWCHKPARRCDCDLLP